MTEKQERVPDMCLGVLDITYRRPAEPYTITGREGRMFVADIVACRTGSGRVSLDRGRAMLQGAVVRAPDGAISKIVGVETFCMPEMGVGGPMGILGILLVPVIDEEAKP